MPITLEELKRELGRPIQIRCSPYGKIELRPFSWDDESDIESIKQLLTSDLSDRDFVVRFLHGRLVSPIITQDEVQSWRIDKLSRVATVWAADKRGLDTKIPKGQNRISSFRQAVQDKIKEGPFAGLMLARESFADNFITLIDSKSTAAFLGTAYSSDALKRMMRNMPSFQVPSVVADIQHMRWLWDTPSFRVLEEIDFDAMSRVLNAGTVSYLDRMKPIFEGIDPAGFGAFHENFARVNSARVLGILADAEDFSKLQESVINSNIAGLRGIMGDVGDIGKWVPDYVTHSGFDALLRNSIDSLVSSIARYVDQTSTTKLLPSGRMFTELSILELQAPVLSSQALVSAIRDDIIEVSPSEPEELYGGYESTVQEGILVLEQVDGGFAGRWQNAWDDLYTRMPDDNSLSIAVERAFCLARELFTWVLEDCTQPPFGIREEYRVLEDWLSNPEGQGRAKARSTVAKTLHASLIAVSAVVAYKLREEAMSSKDIAELIKKWGQNTYQTTPLEIQRIRNWLAQFPAGRPRRLMAKLLQNIDFWNEVRERQAFKVIHSHVTGELTHLSNRKPPQKAILLSAFGGPAKSGLAFVRKYANEVGIAEDHAVTAKEIEATLKDPRFKNIKALVFIDDMIGSGGTQVKGLGNLDASLLELLKARDIVLVITAVWGLASGLERVQSALDEPNMPRSIRPYAYERVGKRAHCFGEASEIFDTEEDRLEARKIAEEYSGKLLPKHPLGWDNGQLLLVFSDNCPNGTLPIIWSAPEGVKWTPLFRRQ